MRDCAWRHVHRDRCRRQYRTVDVAQRHVDLLGPTLARVIDDPEFDAALDRDEGDQAVPVGRSHRVPERLAPASPVDGRPRCHRPGVVQLPDDGAHASRCLGAEGLDAELHRSAWFSDVAQCQSSKWWERQVRRHPPRELAVAVLCLLVRRACPARYCSAVRRGSPR